CSPEAGVAGSSPAGGTVVNTPILGGGHAGETTPPHSCNFRDATREWFKKGRGCCVRVAGAVVLPRCGIRDSRCPYATLGLPCPSSQGNTTEPAATPLSPGLQAAAAA